jgi:hypothetical protein
MHMFQRLWYVQPGLAQQYHHQYSNTQQQHPKVLQQGLACADSLGWVGDVVVLQVAQPLLW